MLHLRVFGASPVMGDVAERLDALPGARHVSVTDAGRGGRALVTADVGAEAADPALTMLRELGVPPDDVALLQFDAIGSEAAAAEPPVLVWADLLGQARLHARSAGRYLVFMAAAGVIAAFGVIDQDQVLIVGAMAVSPDLLPITAACTGIVLRRVPLVRRGLVTLFVGLGFAGAWAAAVTGVLNLFDLLPAGFAVHETGFAAQQHVSAETICVAFAAGAAGMLALETRASAAVGVAISVTTIPASAFLGVAAGVGELRTSLSAFSVLAANVAMMLIGGSVALGVQRKRAART